MWLTLYFVFTQTSFYTILIQFYCFPYEKSEVILRVFRHDRLENGAWILNPDLFAFKGPAPCETLSSLPNFR